VEHNHVLQDKVVIVSLDAVSIPRVDPADRFVVHVLGSGRFKVVHLTVRVGYRDNLDIPAALALARKRGLLERNLDLEGASYFVSRIYIVPTEERTLAPWRKRLFLALARNAVSPIEQFGLPSGRTVELGSQVPL
jgi:KUP system potassium uptake protein